MKAEKDGYVCHMDTESIGIASVCLGAGRSRKDDVIDYKAGIILKKKYGEPVKLWQCSTQMMRSCLRKRRRSF